jgi:hypothetical protein
LPLRAHHLLFAQTNPLQITTPEHVESPIGALDFRDGIPSAGAAAKLYDYLDLTHGVEVFLNGFSGVSMYAIHKGFRDAGVKD